MSLVKEHFGLHNAYNLPPNKDFLCGCEFEIESIKDFLSIDNNFIIEKDHSLRNGGKEFKTRPHSFEETIGLFQNLHASLKLGADPFSDRTSIHVHVNVRELSLFELRQFILTYAMLEPLFFEFVGPVRKNSIFCVPLNYTYIPSTYKGTAQNMLEKWHKYTAFNIVPIANFGTVEFRHLYGTADVKVFSKWLTTIKELYTFITTNDCFDIIKTLSKGEDVAILARMIIPTLAFDYSIAQTMELLEDSVLDVKLAQGGLK